MGKTLKHRKITFYKNYFQDFFDKQSKKVKAKIVWTFDLVEDLQRVPETYLKHIENTDGLYEIRVQLESDIFIPNARDVFLTKDNWLFWQTDFNRKLKRLQRKKLKWHLK